MIGVPALECRSCRAEPRLVSVRISAPGNGIQTASKTPPVTSPKRSVTFPNLAVRDASHLWVWLDVPGRDDNLLCAVLVLEDGVIVKTVMHHCELMP